MQDHNNDNGHKGMMWMMLVCCLLPVIFLVGGSTFFKSIDYGWVGIMLIGVFMVFHLRHMFGSGNNHKTDNQTKNDKDLTNHKGCCH